MFLAEDVPVDRVVEVYPPIEENGAGDVAQIVVGDWVIINFGYSYVLIFMMILDPLSRNQDFGMSIFHYDRLVDAQYNGVIKLFAPKRDHVKAFAKHSLTI